MFEKLLDLTNAALVLMCMRHLQGTENEGQARWICIYNREQLSVFYNT